MKTQLKIWIHSFVDLITNSSTEIYIAAGDSSVTAVKNLVNLLLKAGGGKATCDELFDVSLGEVTSGEYYERCPLVVTAKDPANKEAADILSDLTGIFDIEAAYNG